MCGVLSNLKCENPRNFLHLFPGPYYIQSESLRFAGPVRVKITQAAGAEGACVKAAPAESYSQALISTHSFYAGRWARGATETLPDYSQQFPLVESPQYRRLGLHDDNVFPRILLCASRCHRQLPAERYSPGGFNAFILLKCC